jgi:hypothetical protein
MAGLQDRVELDAELWCERRHWRQRACAGEGEGRQRETERDTERDRESEKERDGEQGTRDNRIKIELFLFKRAHAPEVRMTERAVRRLAAAMAEFRQAKEMLHCTRGTKSSFTRLRFSSTLRRAERERETETERERDNDDDDKKGERVGSTHIYKHGQN